MNPTVNDLKLPIQKAVQHLKDELKTIRSGHANSSLVEGIMVETYGGQAKMRLKEIATITNEDPTTLAIVPFDPSTTSDVEKALLKSPLGINPQTQGNKIILRIPPLSEEQRTKMVKLIHQKVEDEKNVIRNERDEMRRKIKQAFEAKNITEDDKFRMEKDIDKLTQEAMSEIDDIRSRKDNEIMEV
jgi:ribosome recycling factor